MTKPSARSAHLDPHDVTAYVQGTLDPAVRSRVESHLSDCEDCASEVAEVSRLWRPAAPGMRWLAPVAAAAAVVALVLIGPRAEREGRDAVPPVRGDTAAAVVIVAPHDGAALHSAFGLVWRPVPGATAYRISVSRADGDSVWAVTTRDTVVRPPDSVLGHGAELYYWYVDALLSDGRSLAGTAHQFRLGP